MNTNRTHETQVAIWLPVNGGPIEKTVTVQWTWDEHGELLEAITDDGKNEGWLVECAKDFMWAEECARMDFDKMEAGS